MPSKLYDKLVNSYIAYDVEKCYHNSMKRNNFKYTHDRTCVYNINYHIIWGTKYRNKVLSDQIEQDLYKLLQESADRKGFTISHMQVGLDDHVHVLVSAPPKFSITTIVKSLKGYSGRHLFMMHPELSQQYWKSNDRHLWSHSYFVETIGSTSQQAVNNYIDDQRKKEK